MKTLFTALTFLVFTGQSIAEEPEKALRNNIREHLSVPSSMKKSRESVRIDFSINDSGSAQILKIYSQDANIRNEVRHQFLKMKHDRKSYESGKIYSIKVTFQVL